MEVKVTKFLETLVKSHPSGIYAGQDNYSLFSQNDLGIVYDHDDFSSIEKLLSESKYPELTNQDFFMLNWKEVWSQIIGNANPRLYMPRLIKVRIDFAELIDAPDAFKDDAKFNPYVSYDIMRNPILSLVVKSTLYSMSDVEIDQQRIYSDLIMGNVLSSWDQQNQLYRVTDTAIPPGLYTFKVYPLEYTYVIIRNDFALILEQDFDDYRKLPPKYVWDTLVTNVSTRLVTDRMITPTVELRKNNQKGGPTSNPKKQKNCSNPEDYTDLQGEKLCSSQEVRTSHDQSGGNPKEEFELEYE